MRKVLAPLTMFAGLIIVAAIACSTTPTTPPPAPQVQSPPPPPAAQAPAPPAPAQPSQPSNGGSTGGTAFEVTMEDPAGSGAYAFDPSEMTFNVGDTIEFTISAESEYHTFTVDELGIDAEADGGDSTTFSFTFNEAGSFALICIPHEALGMTGTITVQ